MILLKPTIATRANTTMLKANGNAKKKQNTQKYICKDLHITRNVAFYSEVVMKAEGVKQFAISQERTRLKAYHTISWFS